MKHQHEIDHQVICIQAKAVISYIPSILYLLLM